MKTNIAKLLCGKIDSLRNQCYDEKVNAKTVNSIRKALDQFDKVFDDFVVSKDLKAALKEVKEYLGEDDDDTKFMKTDEVYRNEVGEKMTEALTTIIETTGSEFKPTRSLAL
jgi:hypothetical protein